MPARCIDACIAVRVGTPTISGRQDIARSDFVHRRETLDISSTVSQKCLKE
jgi:hypothetical protein